MLCALSGVAGGVGRGLFSLDMQIVLSCEGELVGVFVFVLSGESGLRAK